MAARPPSREPLASWPLSRILMPRSLAKTCSQPFTRSMTEETCGPFSITTLPLWLIASARNWQEISPALTLSVMIVASAPAAATSTATTGMPAACARLTAGAIAFASAAFSRIRSTPEAIKLSIWVPCLFRSYSADAVTTLTPEPALSVMPLVIATKNGLPSEPSVTPIDFRSLAEAVPVASARAAPARSSFFNIRRRLPGRTLGSRRRGASGPAGCRCTGLEGRYPVRLASGASATLEPEAVERDRADDHQALDDELPDVRDAEQHEAVGQHGDDQRADQRAPDRADAADEAGAAQDHGRDGVELVGLADLEAVGGEQARRDHHPAQAGEEARGAVDEEQDRPDLDAGEPRRRRVAAHGVDAHAQHRAVQDEPRHDDDEQRDDGEPRQLEPAAERNAAVADEGERQVRVEDRLVAAHEPRQAADRRQRAQGDDERRQADEGDQRRVEEAEEQAGEHRRRDAEQAEAGDERRHQRGHGRRGEHRTDREVDAPGEDDERHAGGQDRVDRGLLQDDRHVLRREEAVVAHVVEDDADDDQDRQHADRLDHAADLHLPRREPRAPGGPSGRGGRRRLALCHVAFSP